jgi:hypothetical protein
MSLLQQMLSSLQTDISSLTGQFSTDPTSSSANSTGSTTSSTNAAATTAATTASSASSTPSAQFANDTLSALIQSQNQPDNWATNAANSIISADGSNGEISLAQVTGALGSSGSTETSAQISSAFNALDTNGDGQLSATELASALQEMQNQGQTQGVGGHHHHHHMSAPQSSSSDPTSTLDSTTDALGVSSTTAATATSSIATTTTTTTTTTS